MSADARRDTRRRDPGAPGLRVVVVGATGNVGAAVVRALGAGEDDVAFRGPR